jgi:hypothetical protein
LASLASRLLTSVWCQSLRPAASNSNTTFACGRRPAAARVGLLAERNINDAMPPCSAAAQFATATARAGRVVNRVELLAGGRGARGWLRPRGHFAGFSKFTSAQYLAAAVIGQRAGPCLNFSDGSSRTSAVGVSRSATCSSVVIAGYARIGTRQLLAPAVRQPPCSPPAAAAATRGRFVLAQQRTQQQPAQPTAPRERPPAQRQESVVRSD